jgi:hypothetical protein
MVRRTPAPPASHLILHVNFVSHNSDDILLRDRKIGAVAQEAPSGADSLLGTVLAPDHERHTLLLAAETETEPHAQKKRHNLAVLLRRQRLQYLLCDQAVVNAKGTRIFAVFEVEPQS